MDVKNITADNVSINKSVQIDVDTPDVNDGYVLPNQTLDLSKSLTVLDVMNSQQIKDAVYNGSLVFVVDGYEATTSNSIEIYESGPTQWARIFNPEVSKANLREGISGGFIYAKNCLIG